MQPDIIVLGGDIFDLAHFGRYNTDIRDYGLIERMNFVHKEILEPLRTLCPNTQIDFIAGNHEERILKHFSDQTPALRVLLSDFHGMTLSGLLGLDKYGINFISKNDLAAYTLSDSRKEVAKNWKKYYDSFIVHHFPSGSSLGLPGVSGHHHKTNVHSHYNETYGTYSWVENGGGHKLDCEYAHAKWNLGFTIATVDTQLKTTVFDVVTFSETMAVVGGKVYSRESTLT